MKKKLLILFTLVMILAMSLTITAYCFAEDEEVPVAEETQPVIEEAETADNNAVIWFQEVWEKIKVWAIGAFSGVSVGSIVAVIIGVIIKRSTNKGFDKIEKKTDNKETAKIVSGEILKHLANVKIDVEMKSMVESEIRAIYEEITADMIKLMKKQDERNLALIKCFEGLAGYYKCSSAISEEDKQYMLDCIAEAKALYTNAPTSVSAVVEVKQDAKEESKKKITISENY